MATTKQTIQIPLTALREDVDDKMLPDGAFTVLENAQFDKAGRISKRDGYVPLSKSSDQTYSGVQPIVSGSSLVPTQKGELLLYDGTNIWSYRPTAELWNKKNKYIPCSPSYINVFGSDDDKFLMDAASNSRYEFYLYKTTDDSSLKLVAADIDTQSVTNTYTIADSLSSVDAARVATIPQAPNQVVVASSVAGGGSVSYWRETLTDLFNPVEKTLNTGFSPVKKQLELLHLSGSKMLCVWAKASDIYAEIFDFSDPLNPTYSGDLGINTIKSMSVIKHRNSSDWYIGYNPSSGNAVVKKYDDTLSLLATSPTLSIGDEPHGMTSCWASSGSDYCIVFAYGSTTNTDAGGTSTDTCGTFRVSEDLSTGNANFNTADNAWLAGGLISREENGVLNPYLVLGMKDNVQSFYSLAKCDFDYNFLYPSKFLVLEAASDLTQSFVPGWVNTGSFVFGCSKRVVGKSVETTDLYKNKYISRFTFDFSSSISYDHFGESTYVGPSTLRFYDSGGVRSAEFNNYPTLELTTEASTGGSISDGTYLYSAVYEIDNYKGEIIRSAPSVPLSVTASAGTGTSEFQMRYITPSLHEESVENATFNANSKIKIYRTTNGGSIFYLVKEVNMTANSGNKYVFTDRLADSSITDEETIYTTGGELENISLPSISLLTTHKNRLFVAGTDDPRKLYYSKLQVQGEAAAFYADLSKTHEVEIKGLSSLDDKLIVFGSDRIDFIAGDGPDNQGNNDNFSDFIGISDEIGCINKSSIVTADVGVFFLSRRGLYLLTKALQLNYIGAPMETTISTATFLRGVSVSDLSEIRWLLNDGTIIVYNYEFNNWCIHKTFTNAVDIASSQGDFYILFNDGTVWKETADTFTDNSSAYNLKLTTGWISLQQLNKLKRIYDLYLLGNYKSAHTLNIQIAYDYDDTVVDTKTWSTATGLTDGDTVYQIRLRPSRQKVEAIKITIYDDTQSGTSESWSVNALSVVAGVKGSNRQLKNTKYM